MLPHVYAFDVDDTLEVAGGPVAVEALRALARVGHVVGSSEDRVAAETAGFRFLLERDFAAGQR
jgi:hypothetical protein